MAIDTTTLEITLDRGSDETVQFRFREAGALLDLTEVAVELIVQNKPDLTLPLRPDASDPFTGFVDFSKEYAAKIGSKTRDYALRLRWPDGVTKALAVPPMFCFNRAMTTPDSFSVAQSLLLAPAWARVGLTAPNERLRQQAATQLAEIIIASLEASQGHYDARQITLPL